MCVDVIEVSGIRDLPLGNVMEEVSLFGLFPNGKGQIVLLHATVEEVEEVKKAEKVEKANHRRILFETDKTGTKICQEGLFDIKRITYVQRS